MKESEKIEEIENMVEDKKVETKHLKSAFNTAKKVNGEERVDIKIPIDPQNPKDLIVPVVINGYRWNIKRGVKVKVPKKVASILEESKYI